MTKDDLVYVGHMLDTARKVLENSDCKHVCGACPRGATFGANKCTISPYFPPSDPAVDGMVALTC